jgi:hypothetical protein
MNTGDESVACISMREGRRAGAPRPEQPWSPLVGTMTTEGPVATVFDCESDGVFRHDTVERWTTTTSCRDEAAGS